MENSKETENQSVKQQIAEWAESELAAKVEKGGGSAYEKCLRDHAQECGSCTSSGDFIPCV